MNDAPRQAGSSGKSAPVGADFDQGVTIHCGIAGGLVADVSIRTRRLNCADRLVIGKTPEAALTLFGLLFSLCRHAQGRAASLALGRALGVAESPVQEQRREALVSLEIIKEHGLNILLRGQTGGLAPELPQRLLAAIQSLHESLGGERLWGVRASSPGVIGWQYARQLKTLHVVLQELHGELWALAQPDLAAVLKWQECDTSPAARLLHRVLQAGWADFGRCRIAPLPALVDECIEPMMARESMQTPTWEGSARETNSYTRQAGTLLLQEACRVYGNGLFSRILARLMETKAMFDRLPQDLSDVNGFEQLPATRASGIGLAQVEASRGRLIHRVVVKDGRIADYAILAPTEWNFHPRGLVYQALLGAKADDSAVLESQFVTLLRTIDPCVDFRLMLNGA